MHTKRDASPGMLALPAFSYLHVVKYTKPALSLDAQKALLTERGLRINSDVLLRKLLRDYGFARLDAYCEAFVLSSGTRNFRKSTSLSQVWQVIKLDEDLRNLLFPYLIRIELAIKAGLVEYLAQEGGAFVYMNREIFHDQALHVKLLAHASETWLRSSDQQTLAFRRKYNETKMPPIWYLMQALPLGSVSKWISNLKIPFSQDLMNALHLPTQRNFIKTGLQGLTILRNFCAHGARIWNCVFPVSFMVDQTIPRELNPQRLAAALSLVELCLDRLDLNVEQFRTRRSSILATVPRWQLQLMGYPSNYQN